MVWLRLFRGLGLAGVGFGELAAEAFDAACGVDQLLLAGKVGVAGRADFDDDIAFVRGAGLKGGSAGALDVDVFVLRVNSGLWHVIRSFSELVLPSARGSLATVEFTSHRSACRAAVYAPGKGALKQCFKFI